jgi:hypothetical protein
VTFWNVSGSGWFEFEVWFDGIEEVDGVEEMGGEV